jgi:hypothetical protein
MRELMSGCGRPSLLSDDSRNSATGFVVTETVPGTTLSPPVAVRFRWSFSVVECCSTPVGTEFDVAEGDFCEIPAMTAGCAEQWRDRRRVRRNAIRASRDVEPRDVTSSAQVALSFERCVVDPGGGRSANRELSQRRPTARPTKRHATAVSKKSPSVRHAAPRKESLSMGAARGARRSESGAPSGRASIHGHAVLGNQRSDERSAHYEPANE